MTLPLTPIKPFTETFNMTPFVKFTDFAGAMNEPLQKFVAAFNDVGKSMVVLGDEITKALAGVMPPKREAVRVALLARVVRRAAKGRRARGRTR